MFVLVFVFVLGYGRGFFFWVCFLVSWLRRYVLVGCCGFFSLGGVVLGFCCVYLWVLFGVVFLVFYCFFFFGVGVVGWLWFCCLCCGGWWVFSLCCFCFFGFLGVGWGFGAEGFFVDGGV